MSVQERDGIYSVHYLDLAGKQRQKSCGRGDEGRIKAYELDALIKAQKQANKEATRDFEVMTSTVPQSPVIDAKSENYPLEAESAITFEKLVNEYLANSQVNGSTEDHRKSITYVAEKLYYPFFGRETPINRISYSDILGFMTWIESENSQNGRKRSPITINRYGHFLSAFFRYAVDLGYLDKIR